MSATRQVQREEPGAPAPTGAASVAPARVARIAAGDPGLRAGIERLLEVSRRGLPRMFRADLHGFAHTRRLPASGAAPVLEGDSLRYGAIVALGVRHLPLEGQRAIFAGEDAGAFCDRLLEAVRDVSNLGDHALVVWAAAALDRPGLGDALQRLATRCAAEATPYTVELAWTLSALVAAGDRGPDGAARDRVRERLLGAFSPAAGVFPHRIGGAPGLRSHVACFADQVYPIQALARHHHAFGDAPALSAAERCAERICELQGPEGQWWWHYDARTGAVLEGYPVYSVHQDAMGPMALLDLVEAGGREFDAAIRRGLRWMERAPEVGRSLIDAETAVIWRKVARREPRKLVRRLRAAASRIHPALRLGGLDGLFPPREIEFESRPYHLGWVLDTWLGGL